MGVAIIRWGDTGCMRNRGKPTLNSDTGGRHLQPAGAVMMVGALGLSAVGPDSPAGGRFRGGAILSMDRRT